MFSNRKAALAAGEVRFFTGRECSRGHVADRYASTGTCVECLAGAKRPRGSLTSESWTSEADVLGDRAARVEGRIEALRASLEELRAKRAECLVKAEAAKLVESEARQTIAAAAQDRAMIREAAKAEAVAKEAHRELMATVWPSFVKVILESDPRDIQTLRDTVVAQCWTRIPDLPRERIVSAAAPKAGVLYSFMVHPDDETILRRLANDMYSARNPAAAVTPPAVEAEPEEGDDWLFK